MGRGEIQGAPPGATSGLQRHRRRAPVDVGIVLGAVTGDGVRLWKRVVSLVLPFRRHMLQRRRSCQLLFKKRMIIGGGVKTLPQVLFPLLSSNIYFVPLQHLSCCLRSSSPKGSDTQSCSCWEKELCSRSCWLMGTCCQETTSVHVNRF